MTLGARPHIWGVLNVTPDSFSDGGLYSDVTAALHHARTLVGEGADVIDVGGESTRPGASRVEASVEQARVIPVVSALVAEGIRVSVDTMRADTADKALEAGAHIINDVSGGLADPDMFAVVAQAECDFVVMHWRGHSESMEAHAHYGDVVAEVRSELGARVAAAVGAGIDPARIIVDPGLGFGKKANHNWEILKHCDDLVAVGTRMVVGASRKRFVGALLPDGHAVTERDEPSAVLGALLASQGVWALRVHNVAAQARALDVWQAVTQGGTHV